MFNFFDIQIGRQLEEREVCLINYIIKLRAKKYIAAVQREWLFPEEQIGTPRWDKISENHFLMPDPRSMTFSTNTVVGYKSGMSDGFDAYGRKPWEKEYGNQAQQDEEWNTFHAFQGEYARLHGPKRKGRSHSMTKLDDEVDSDDYHRYHLSLESEFKPLLKRRKKR